MIDKKYSNMIFTLLFILGVCASGFADNGKIMGAKSCKKCHISSKTGAQYKVWSKMKHAHAFDVLATDAAKKTAQAKGIADPQKSDACLKCHVTGHGLSKEKFDESFKISMGVQCESCHGPGEKHVAIREKAKKEEKTTGKKTPLSKDEIITKPEEKVCKECHNKESPDFKGFDFKEMYKKVSHPKPDKK